MRSCAGCRRDVEAAFRFCPWCGAPLRCKLVEYFRGAAGLDPGRALRVSRYLGEGHVRFSVWSDEGEAEAAISLDEDEAARLVGFLGPGPERRVRVAVGQVLARLR